MKAKREELLELCKKVVRLPSYGGNGAMTCYYDEGWQDLIDRILEIIKEEDHE